MWSLAFSSFLIPLLQVDIGFKELENVPIFGDVLSSLGKDCALHRLPVLYFSENREAREEELIAEPPLAVKLRPRSCKEGTDSPRMLVKNADSQTPDQLPEYLIQMILMHSIFKNDAHLEIDA